jgi:hypothetical protein
MTMGTRFNVWQKMRALTAVEFRRLLCAKGPLGRWLSVLLIGVIVGTPLAAVGLVPGRPSESAGSTKRLFGPPVQARTIASQNTLAAEAAGEETADVYDIGSIPPLHVRRGFTLAFRVRSPTSPAATFSMTRDSTIPSGPMSLDRLSGLFTYSPSADDKADFTVMLASAVSGIPVESQQLVISPIATVMPEFDLIRRTDAPPDPASPDYLVVTQAANPTQEMFNGVNQVTWNAEITGKTVIFDNADAAHGNLYTRFQSRRDLKKLTIYAETLIVRSAVSLPGTNVTVYARELRFEDQAGKAAASVDTTPLANLLMAPQFQNGVEGQKGGDVRLLISAWWAQGTAVRLISGGGRGQDPGPGRPGNPKPAAWSDPIWNYGGTGALGYPFPHQGWGWIYGVPGNTDARVVSITHSAGYCQFRIDGSQTWPEDGETGVPAGIPGTGGPGGSISASLASVQAFVRAPGGTSAQPGTQQAGGPPQEPRHALWVKSIDGSRCSQDYFNFMVVGEHFSQPGMAAPSVSAARPRGTDGTFSTLSITPLTWLHPYALRMVIAHAKDAYRLGDLAYAQGVFQDYSALLERSLSSASEFGDEFEQDRVEMQVYLLRLASSMDYFGHTAGWVPLLSLEATMSAFNSEVDAAVPVLFLSRWLQARANQNVKDIGALQDGITRVQAEAEGAAADVNGASESVPRLRAEAAQVAAQADAIQQRIEERKAQLLREAEQNVADRKKTNGWMKALGVIGAVAQVVPVYQPALGIIGQGLSFVSQFDDSKPLESLSKAPVKDLTSLFSGKTWEDSAADYNKLVQSLNLKTETNRAALETRLQDAYNNNRSLIAQTVDQLKATQISSDDVQREFDQIEKQDSTFKDLIQQVTDLLSKKQALAEGLSGTLASIASGTSTIQQDITALSSMNRNLDATASQFDHAMLVYVRAMEQRARERLLRYQYYMAKAYEYRMLKPYMGDLNVDSVVNRILSVIGTMSPNGYPANPADIEAIKAVYKDSVRQIAYSAINELQSRPPERSLPFYFKLTPEELEELNQTGQLTLDISPRIAGLPNEDNRHIADFRVADMSVQTDGQIGSFGRVRVLIDHHGQSVETQDGHRYSFHFGNGADDRPFTWGCSYSLPSGPLSQENLTIAGLSLLRSLLNMPGSPDPSVDPLVLFARPGADAVVTLTKSTSPASLHASIASLQIGVTIDFFRQASSRTRLTVQESAAGSSYVALNRPDITGRQDGRGQFIRTFEAGQSVAVTAEAFYGDMKFRKWLDDTGTQLSTSPTLQLSMLSNRQIVPVYALDTGVPTTPAPMDRVSGVASDVGLTWQSTGATSYDVGFGTSNPPPPAATGLTAALFKPATLAPATTYFWRVTARGESGTAPGPVWSFTTSAAAPVSIPGAPSPTPRPLAVTVSPSTIQFGAVRRDTALSAVTGRQTVWVMLENGPGNWTAVSNQPWLRVLNGSGVGTAGFGVEIVDSGNLPIGLLKGSITVITPGALQATQTIGVSLTISTQTSGPVGVIETPQDGATGLTGGLAVTGWALDDVDVTSVTVCRAGVEGELLAPDGRCGGAAEVFVGDGLFVEGARPDVQAAYPTLPRNARAGWGLMVLTNMLPRIGNGTFRFSAYATDREGHTVLLGRRTVSCDNAHSTRPFGAIDTPAPGEVVSGTIYSNFGWVLSPSPGLADPPDGGTVTVIVDGHPVGSPAAWGPRSDLSALFDSNRYPGVTRAQAVFPLDLTTLSNGVHTIAWIVTDQLGRSEGIGSRFFTVVNSSKDGGAMSSRSLAIAAGAEMSPAVTAISPDARSVRDRITVTPLDTQSIAVRRGYSDESAFQTVTPAANGRLVVQAEEADRIEIALGVAATDEEYTGYLRIAKDLGMLPAGSRLDTTAHRFTWQPGAGFVGTYDFVFVRSAATGPITRQEIRIILNPKQSSRVGPQVAIERPAASDDQILAQPFVLGGSAIDLDAGASTGIDTILVWAYPTSGAAPLFVGVATYGENRPDVAAVHGERYQHSGYDLTVSDLPPGEYDLTVFARKDGSGTFAPPRIIRLNVK